MGYSHERGEKCRAVVLADHIAADRDVLERLRATPGIEFIHQFDRQRSEADDVEWPLRPVMDSAAEATEAHLARGSVPVRIKPRAAPEET
jgi:hypothetical protein